MSADELREAYPDIPAILQWGELENTKDVFWKHALEDQQSPESVYECMLCGHVLMMKLLGDVASVETMRKLKALDKEYRTQEAQIKRYVAGKLGAV